MQPTTTPSSNCKYGIWFEKNSIDIKKKKPHTIISNIQHIYQKILFIYEKFKITCLFNQDTCFIIHGLTEFFWVNFLQDFQRNGHKFTEQLCLADSDRDGVPNGVELGLNTTRHNIQTLCQFVASYTFNAKLINFLERKSLLGRPIGHPGKKGVSSSISHTEIPCSVRNMYNVSIHGL